MGNLTGGNTFALYFLPDSLLAILRAKKPMKLDRSSPLGELIDGLSEGARSLHVKLEPEPESGTLAARIDIGKAGHLYLRPDLAKVDGRWSLGFQSGDVKGDRLPWAILFAGFSDFIEALVRKGRLPIPCEDLERLLAPCGAGLSFGARWLRAEAGCRDALAIFGNLGAPPKAREESPLPAERELAVALDGACFARIIAKRAEGRLGEPVALGFVLKRLEIRCADDYLHVSGTLAPKRDDAKSRLKNPRVQFFGPVRFVVDTSGSKPNITVDASKVVADLHGGVAWPLLLVARKVAGLVVGWLEDAIAGAIRGAITKAGDKVLDGVEDGQGELESQLKLPVTLNELRIRSGDLWITVDIRG